MRRRSCAGIGCFGMSTIFGFAMSILWLLSLWTDRNLEFWLSYWKGRPIVVPGWISFLLTLVLNAIILTANIIGELLRLAMT